MEPSLGDIRTMAVRDHRLVFGVMSGALYAMDLRSQFVKQISQVWSTANDPACSVRAFGIGQWLVTTRSGKLHRLSSVPEADGTDTSGFRSIDCEIPTHDGEADNLVASSLAVDRSHSLAVVAGRQSSRVFWLRAGDTVPQCVSYVKPKSSSVVSCIRFIDRRSASPISDAENKEFAIALCYKTGVVTLLIINSTQSTVKHQLNLSLPSGKHNWLAAGCLIHDGKVLVLGDRNGSISTYRVDFEHNQDSSVSGQTPCCTIPSVHGRLGVTDLTIDVDHPDVLHSLGRDGRYLIWRFDGDSDLEHSLTLLCTKRIGNGVGNTMEWPNQFHAMVVGDTTSAVAGFHGESFTLYSNTSDQQQPLCAINCGGGHREWAMHQTESAVKLAFIKQGQVVVVSCPCIVKYDVLQPLLHGQQVSCIAPLTDTNGKELNPILVSGSIENSLCAWSLNINDALATPMVLDRCRDHLSSIHAVDVRGDRVVTVGARSEMRIYAVLKLSSNRRVLRPLAAHRDLRSQCRYLSVKFITDHVLAVARSDSQIWLFGFDESSGQLQPLNRRLLDNETSSNDVIGYGCVTQLTVSTSNIDDSLGGSTSIFHVSAVTSSSHLLVWSLNSDVLTNVYTVSMKSYGDGREIWRSGISALTSKQLAREVGRYDFEPSIRPFMSVNTDSSGLSTTDSVYLSSAESLLVAVGSEMGVVSLHLFPEADQEQSSTSGTTKILECRLQCHASTVTGVRLHTIMPSEAEKDVELFTLSIGLDQRLILCALTATNGLCLVQCVALACSHPLALCVKRSKTSRKRNISVTIAGAGFDTVELKLPDSNTTDVSL